MRNIAGPAVQETPMDERTDRRSRRTRRAVIDAMVALLRERPFTEITVQHVIDRADIGRATFYAHFRDKLDVVDAVMSDVLDGLHAGPDSVPAGGTAGALSLRALFRHVADRSDQFRAMLSAPGAEVFWGQARATLADAVEAQLRALPPAMRDHPGVPPEVRAHVVAGAVDGAFRWWLAEGLPYPPDRMADFVEELLPTGRTGV
jgi:AcrR family transcriptional regulator